MKPIKHIKNLTLYSWDWKEEVKGLPGTEMNTGFRAQEVKLKYPNCVSNINGILAIDYEKLNKTLEAA